MPVALSEALLDACVGLVQRAETLRPDDCEQTAQLALHCACACTDPRAAKLAFAIERICDELAAGRVAVGVSLPSLCGAADQLHSAFAPNSPAASVGLEAARFEIDTLLPLPQATPPALPVIAASALLRRNDRIPVDPRVAMQQRRAQRMAALPTPLAAALAALREQYQP